MKNERKLISILEQHWDIPIALLTALAAALVIPKIPDEAQTIVSQLLGLFLVSVLGLTQLVALLYLKDEWRRLANSLLDWKYKSFLFILALATITALPANGGSLLHLTLPWADHLLVDKLAIFLFAGSTVYFVLFFLSFLPRVSSLEVVVRHFVNQIIREMCSREIYKDKAEKVLEKINHIVDTGKDAGAGYETNLIIEGLLRLAQATLEQPGGLSMNQCLTRTLEGLAEVVCAGQLPGDDANGVKAIKALEKLYEISLAKGVEPFDYGRFVFVVSNITNFAVSRGYTQATRRGSQVLKKICIKQIERGEEQADKAALYLAKAGELHIQRQDFDGAVEVASQLSSLLEIAKEKGFAGSHVFLFHTLSVYAYIWESKLYAKPAFEPFTKNLKNFQALIPKALDYGKAIAPIKAALVEKFIAAIRSSNQDHHSWG